MKLNIYLFLICVISFERAKPTPSCMELMATSYFGVFNSCFNHAIENLKELFVFYAQTGISGLSFGLINGQNLSYIENRGFTNTEKIDLSNSHLTGVEIWTAENGISGLKFQIYSQDIQRYHFTSLMGSNTGCYSYLNSSFMKTNFFKINSISGCVDDKNSNEFPSINFQYSFSQCPLFLFSSSTTTETSNTSSTTETSTSSTTTETSTTSTTTSQSRNLTIFLDDSCIFKSKPYFKLSI